MFVCNFYKITIYIWQHYSGHLLLATQHLSSPFLIRGPRVSFGNNPSTFPVWVWGNSIPSQSIYLISLVAVISLKTQSRLKPIKNAYLSDHCGWQIVIWFQLMQKKGELKDFGSKCSTLILGYKIEKAAGILWAQGQPA